MDKFFKALFLLLLLPFVAQAQSALSKYGNDFLSTGAGARALGMGSAYVAHTNDVTSAYWNVAGLSAVSDIEVMYMHSERFGGIVGYDYGAVALPLSSKNSVFSISFFRQGVDNIANTLNAWDKDRNAPKENPEAYITRFSAADMAVFFSFATQRSEMLSYGATAKIINQRLGPFANAWGYSLDIGAQFKTDFANFGISLRNITTLQKMWDVNENEFEGFQEVFGDSIPSGQNEYVLPSVSLGASKEFSFNDFKLITALDTELLFENRRAYYLNVGSMSLEPHVGAELSYKDLISFRTGVTDFVTDPVSGFSVSPTLGLGLQLKSFNLDYGFASFAGSTSTLGFTHRISLRYMINSRL
ncbi:MAG: PorV/PorQ family protein [Balneolaceae bacterium]